MIPPQSMVVMIKKCDANTTNRGFVVDSGWNDATTLTLLLTLTRREGTKPATLASGKIINVPSFIEVRFKYEVCNRVKNMKNMN